MPRPGVEESVKQPSSRSSGSRHNSARQAGEPHAYSKIRKLDIVALTCTLAAHEIGPEALCREHIVP